MDWLFDGVGTMLLGLILGGGVGGAAGFKIGVKSTRQSQRGGDNAVQTQVGRDMHKGD